MHVKIVSISPGRNSEDAKTIMQKHNGRHMAAGSARLRTQTHKLMATTTTCIVANRQLLTKKTNDIPQTMREQNKFAVDFHETSQTRPRQSSHGKGRIISFSSLFLHQHLFGPTKTFAFLFQFSETFANAVLIRAMDPSSASVIIHRTLHFRFHIHVNCHHVVANKPRNIR